MWFFRFFPDYRGNFSQIQPTQGAVLLVLQVHARNCGFLPEILLLFDKILWYNG